MSGAMLRWPDWRGAVTFAPDAPSVTVLHESTDLKVVLVALNAGQQLPSHPGPAACFHILDGSGTVLVDDEQIAAPAGCTVIAPPGSRRSVRADTALVFLGNLGNPGAEAAPA